MTYQLPAPAGYFPYRSGVFSVSPGLAKLGKSFGNGAADSQLTQIDSDWYHYFGEKIRSKEDSISKYIVEGEDYSRSSKMVAKKLLEIILSEHDEYFCLQGSKASGFNLTNRLTKQSIVFDRNYSIVDVYGSSVAPSSYHSLLEALTMQLQEDLIIIRDNRVVALYVYFPNHWAPERMLGKNFFDVHKPVPGMNLTTSSVSKLLSALTKKEYVRFAWGVSSDTWLNHHPLPASEIDNSVWAGRRIDWENPKIYLRVERQVSQPMQDKQGFLFFIRTYFSDIAKLNEFDVEMLLSALKTMSPKQLLYKGLDQQVEELINYLERRLQYC